MTDIEDLAARADRAMRTSAARNTAHAVYAFVRDHQGRVLDSLATLRGWSRRNDREFLCAFGGRSAIVALPTSFDDEQTARLITRTEVNVFLGGGADDLLMRELQAMAQRELERLFDDAD